MIHIILTALGPIVVGLSVGWICGAFGYFQRDTAHVFADFVVKIALPFALFLAAATASPEVLFNADYALALAVGLIVTFVVGFGASIWVFKHERRDAAMQALSTSFPDMAYCGPPVLLAVVGSSGLIAMVIGNLIYTVVVLPITMVLVAPKGQQGQHGMLKTVLKPIMQPLVILPVLGAILAITGVKLPEIAQNSIDELGKTAGGVALFFLGLLLSGIKFQINKEIVFNVFTKNILQGALILGAGLALGLEGSILQAAFIIGILPTTTAVPALAISNNAYTETAAGTVLLSTLLSLVTITTGIYIAERLA